jgi:general secretion pathway protein G
MNDQQASRRRGRAAGFTLVELMVVIAIIAILATIVGVNVLGRMDTANVTAAQAQIRNLKTAVIGYKLQHKKFPQRLEELVGGDNPILDAKEIPKDPWGNPYQYSVDGHNFKILSYGADGRAGGSSIDADVDSDSLESNNQ